jgi:hypothetical protein
MEACALSSMATDWLPGEPRSAHSQALEPWRPSGIEHLVPHGTSRSDRRWGELTHLVIDELHDGVVGLVLSDWPRVDHRGRLVFGDERDGRRLACPADEFLTLLGDRRLVAVDSHADVPSEQLARRDLAIGDVFGAFATRPPGGGGGLPVPPGGPGDGSGFVPAQDLLEGTVVLDVTAEAREVVKRQASAAVSGVIDDEFLELLAREFLEDEGTGEGGEPEPPQKPHDSGDEGQRDKSADQTVRARTVGDGQDSLRDALEEATDESAEQRKDRPMEMGA